MPIIWRLDWIYFVKYECIMFLQGASLDLKLKVLYNTKSLACVYENKFVNFTSTDGDPQSSACGAYNAYMWVPDFFCQLKVPAKFQT